MLYTPLEEEISLGVDAHTPLPPLPNRILGHSPSRLPVWRGFAFQGLQLGLELPDTPEKVAGALPAHLAVQELPAVFGLLGIAVHALRASHAASGAGHGLASFGSVGHIDLGATAGRAG